METFDMNLWAVLLAAVVYFLLGALWYSLFFGKMWQRLIEMPPEERNKPAPAMIFTFLVRLLSVYVLAHFLHYTQATTWLGGMETAFWIWLGFIVVTAADEIFFANKSIRLFLINTGYHLVGLLLAGIILTIWR